jgi:uncharacterized membrane protein YkvA (DUF1232 family)
MADRLKRSARSIKGDVIAISFAVRDPRVPWYAKVLAICVAGYALSPIDLVPDFVPVLGYLDDVVIVPLGILAVVQLIPPWMLQQFEPPRWVATLQKFAAGRSHVRFAPHPRHSRGLISLPKSDVR